MAENAEKGFGYIVVQVATADSAIPVPGANVLVSRTDEGGEALVSVMKTDRNGKTNALRVAAPSAENSLTPEGVNRFFKYNIRIDYPGYYTVENVNVPVFEGQTSIQPVALIPLEESRERGRIVRFTEEEPFENE